MSIDTLIDTMKDPTSPSFPESARHLITFAKSHGLSPEQTAALATSIASSGKVLHLPSDCQPASDVPSTGGPSSLSTLLCPLLIAAVDVYVPKISATGSVAGAIDTLSTIPNFSDHLSEEEFLDCLKRVRIAHVMQTDDFAPSDCHLISIRRESGAMAVPSLAVSSLLSKKLAAGTHNAAFDIRVGSAGNFGATTDEATKNCHLLVQTASILDLRVVCVLTDLSFFQSSFVGRLEALYGIVEYLRHPVLEERHLATCIELSAHACAVADESKSLESWRAKIQSSLGSGKAYETFLAHISAQSSSEEDLEFALNSRLEQLSVPVHAYQEGYVISADMESIGQAVRELSTECRNLGLQEVGFCTEVNRGDHVSENDILGILRIPKKFGTSQSVTQVTSLLARAFHIAAEQNAIFPSTQILGVVEN